MPINFYTFVLFLSFCPALSFFLEFLTNFYDIWYSGANLTPRYAS